MQAAGGEAVRRLWSGVEWVGIERALLETAILLVVLGVLRALALWLVRRNTQDVRSRYHWSKGITYAVAVAGVFLIGRVWFEGVRSLATFLGLLSAGLAVALKDPVQNVAGWLYIVSRRPFVVGDRVQLGRDAGDVIDQRLFQFSILEIGNWVEADQSTGRIVHIPNGRVFTEPLANYTRAFPYIWNELAVDVTFESDWRGAKATLLDIARRHCASSLDDARQRLIEAGHRLPIEYSTVEPAVYTSVRENGVRLTIRYFCEARRRRGTAQAIWEDVLDAFAARDTIMFAYPTRRFFDNATEGKPGARRGGGG